VAHWWVRPKDRRCSGEEKKEKKKKKKGIGKKTLLYITNRSKASLHFFFFSLDNR